MGVLPLLQPSPAETLAERCSRLAEAVGDYERDLLGKVLLDLTAIRVALDEAGAALAEADRMLTELGS